MPNSDVTHVVDANVVAAWSLDRPWSVKAAEFRTSEFNVTAPDLIIPEVGNVLWMNVKEGVLSNEQAMESYAAVAAFVALVPSAGLRYEALNLAIDLGHSIYDCFYLALAKRENVPVVTADRKLSSRASKAGLSVVLLADQV